MLAYVNWDTLNFIIAEVEQDMDWATKNGYIRPERYYVYKEIFLEGRKNSDIYHQILGANHNYLDDNVGFTRHMESYVCPITNDQKEQFLEAFGRSTSVALDKFKRKAEEYRITPMENRMSLLKKLLVEADAQEKNQALYFDILESIVVEESNKIKELASKTGEKQLLSQRFVHCNNNNEECNMDIIYEYVHPDGKLEEIREHCY
jgi:hypothetical protein